MKRRIAAVVAAVALLAGAALAVLHTRGPTRTGGAPFTATVGVPVGSDVRVLGGRGGSGGAVRPEGATGRGGMRYAARYAVPAGASAVIIPPSVVSDRYVQLIPAYTGGPRLPDGADLPTWRTAVPLEVDDVYKALDRFNRALGPQGANADSALSDL